MHSTSRHPRILVPRRLLRYRHPAPIPRPAGDGADAPAPDPHPEHPWGDALEGLRPTGTDDAREA